MCSVKSPKTDTQLKEDEVTVFLWPSSMVNSQESELLCNLLWFLCVIFLYFYGLFLRIQLLSLLIVAYTDLNINQYSILFPFHIKIH